MQKALKNLGLILTSIQLLANPVFAQDAVQQQPVDATVTESPKQEVIHFNGSLEEFKKLIQDSKVPVIVDFWATWCGPCRNFGPVFEDVQKQEAGHALFVKVDVDENEAIASNFGVHGIPDTRVFITKGDKSENIKIGAIPKADLFQREIKSGLAKMEKRAQLMSSLTACSELSDSFLLDDVADFQMSLGSGIVESSINNYVVGFGMHDGKSISTREELNKVQSGDFDETAIGIVLQKSLRGDLEEIKDDQTFQVTSSTRGFGNSYDLTILGLNSDKVIGNLYLPIKLKSSEPTEVHPTIADLRKALGRYSSSVHFYVPSKDGSPCVKQEAPKKAKVIEQTKVVEEVVSKDAVTGAKEVKAIIDAVKDVND